MTTSGTKKPAEAPVVRPRPATADHLKKKRPATRVVEVVLDPDAARAVHEAEDRLDVAKARLRLTPDDDEKQAAVWAAKADLDSLRAQAAADEVVVAVQFRSIGHHAYDALVRAHPPTEEQIAEVKAVGAELGFNADTFPPAIVAAALVDPPLSADEVAALWDSPSWNQAELATLFSAAVEVNSSRYTLDLTAPKDEV